VCEASGSYCDGITGVCGNISHGLDIVRGTGPEIQAFVVDLRIQEIKVVKGDPVGYRDAVVVVALLHDVPLPAPCVGPWLGIIRNRSRGSNFVTLTRVNKSIRRALGYN
jgi:hypothetical protein